MLTIYEVDDSRPNDGTHFSRCHFSDYQILMMLPRPFLQQRTPG